ncbi:DENN domain-containing protein 1B [Tupaia chinensis]|uniref:DENN domain-containing protein 1B n=1 Tax=Tupaia chinensis TaxID=246437 RepID=L9K5B3_TUPCH|nr:DENN domain-containing protein 1B [Tupaia chinensis]
MYIQLEPEFYLSQVEALSQDDFCWQRNLTEYFVAVDVNNMLQLYASMLHERRIIITASKLSTLTACVHASAALLYPMHWQHIYVPVLPPHLLDYCCAPMPYLIGIHSSLIERVKNKSLEDVVMLNVDTNTLESPFNDLSNLPSDVNEKETIDTCLVLEVLCENCLTTELPHASLNSESYVGLTFRISWQYARYFRSNLEVWKLKQKMVSALKNKLKKQSTATGDGVARAFLRAQAALFGSYRDALRYKPGEPITFCEVSFVKHRSSVMKQFLDTAVNLQLFKQFIDGRLAKLNAGRGFSDIFEEEITSGGFCGGNPRTYQQWVHTVKKGGALFNTAMTKATPAVRTAYKFENEEDYGSCSGSVQYTPVYTSHNEKGGDLERHKLAQARLKRPLKSCDGALCDEDDDDIERASKLSSEDGEEAPAYFYESDDSVETRVKIPYSGEMDLLGEILDTLSTHSSDQGKLAAAKSLDFFRSMDDIDYKPTNKSNAPSENNLALLCSGSGDQAEWPLGQDDSAPSGHLPPAPRKRVSSGGLAESLFILREECAGKQLGARDPGGPSGAEGPAESGSESLLAPGVAQRDGAEADAEPRETLSRSCDAPLPPGLGRRPSTSVPWEREGKEAKETPEGPGLLQEVVSLCHMASDCAPGPRVSEENTGGNRA